MTRTGLKRPVLSAIRGTMIGAEATLTPAPTIGPVHFGILPGGLKKARRASYPASQAQDYGCWQLGTAWVLCRPYQRANVAKSFKPTIPSPSRSLQAKPCDEQSPAGALKP